MPDPLALVVYVLVGLATTAFLVVVLRRPHRARLDRRARLAAHAARVGLRHTPSAPELVARLPGEPFDRGHFRRVDNVLEGELRGRTFLALDYTRMVAGGQHSRTQHFSVVAIHLGRLAQPVPMLQVTPRGGLGTGLRGLVGAELPTGDPAFDPLLQVTGASPELARDVLAPPVRAALLHLRHRTWRLEGEWLVAHRRDLHDPEDVEREVAAAVHVLDLVPATVWTRLGRAA